MNWGAFVPTREIKEFEILTGLMHEKLCCAY